MFSLKLKWTRRALDQLVAAQDYIAQENPVAARQVGERIADATRLLLTQPGMGHQGRGGGTLEWLVQGTPRFLVYKLKGDEPFGLSVIHGKEHWL